jgi:hypothetical protein
MIDPQMQANQWLRKKEESNNVMITTMRDANLLRTLENCIRLGKPLILEVKNTILLLCCSSTDELIFIIYACYILGSRRAARACVGTNLTESSVQERFALIDSSRRQ